MTKVMTRRLVKDIQEDIMLIPCDRNGVVNSMLSVDVGGIFIGAHADVQSRPDLLLPTICRL